ncbi:hypothetical protein [Microcoleus sp. CAWBG58]|uniref:hypothetical protein n=1 Tax=Microcoleus sp. CAWBG58 TaxID=2841651 RepID=UPI0025D3AFC4|nr:hypothetical protein [Microcoleus sp. CAWBG58]
MGWVIFFTLIPTVNGQRSTVNGQRSTVNGQLSTKRAGTHHPLPLQLSTVNCQLSTVNRISFFFGS